MAEAGGYPRTPIRFFRVCAATLTRALEMANAEGEEHG